MRHLLDDQPCRQSVANFDRDGGNANDGHFGEQVNDRSLDGEVGVADLPQARRLGPEPDLSDDTGRRIEHGLAVRDTERLDPAEPDALHHRDQPL
jgi:hypothetical protein